MFLTELVCRVLGSHNVQHLILTSENVKAALVKRFISIEFYGIPWTDTLCFERFVAILKDIASAYSNR